MKVASADDDTIIEQLAHGRLHPFADWQDAHVPPVAIGLYTIWKDDQFLYVGMAGKASVEKLLIAKKSGLRNRLRNHARVEGQATSSASMLPTSYWLQPVIQQQMTSSATMSAATCPSDISRLRISP